jgi:hypothetical protein
MAKASLSAIVAMGDSETGESGMAKVGPSEVIRDLRRESHTGLKHDAKG